MELPVFIVLVLIFSFVASVILIEGKSEGNLPAIYKKGDMNLGLEMILIALVISFGFVSILLIISHFNIIEVIKLITKNYE